MTPDDVVQVLQELLPAQNQSYALGLQLNLPRSVVEDICAKHLQPHDRLHHVLLEFTNQVESRPTWKVIVDALKSPAVNLLPLAIIVEAAHFPSPTSTREATPPVTIPETSSIPSCGEISIAHLVSTCIWQAACL